MQTFDVASLVVTLIRSTATYSMQHMHNKGERDAYTKAMRHCAYLCDPSVFGNDLETYLSNVLRARTTYKQECRRNKSLFFNPGAHYMLGIEQTLSIVRAISTRFVTGYSCPESTFIHNIGV